MKCPTPLGLSVLLALALPAAGQVPPSPEALPPEPAGEAMLYERDFELLLEQARVPTAGQVVLDEKLASLRQERTALERQRGALQGRLDSISGSFTMVQAAEEMTRQGVHDLREARKNLEHDLAEIRVKLDLLERRERELQERRAR